MTAEAPRFASVILAAGAATRFGRPKMLSPLPGAGTVLATAVRPHLEAGVERVVVVLGCRGGEVREAAGLPADPRVRVVLNGGWEEGMASSLRLGIERCGDAVGALVALGDQVGVGADRVRSIVGAWSPGCPIVVPVHEQRASHPVLFSRELWPELLRLRGDVGGRSVVERHWAEARLVAAEPLWDLDTPEDYEAFLRGEGAARERGLLPPGRREV
jgi:molybdenum cofactor cytidylyltransferase